MLFVAVMGLLDVADEDEDARELVERVCDELLVETVTGRLEVLEDTDAWELVVGICDELLLFVAVTGLLDVTDEDDDA